MIVKIDPEFESLLLPPRAEELRLLEESLIAYGCRDNLKVWYSEKDKADLVLDGHNRYRICQLQDIKFGVSPISLESREEALLWIAENQLGRRNLTDDQRAAVLDDIRERRSRIANGKRPSSVTDEAVDTRKEIAAENNVPENKLKSVQKLKRIDPALATKVRTGEKTLRQAQAQVAIDNRLFRQYFELWPAELVRMGHDMAKEQLKGQPLKDLERFWKEVETFYTKD